MPNVPLPPRWRSVDGSRDDDGADESADDGAPTGAAFGADGPLSERRERAAAEFLDDVADPDPHAGGGRRCD